MSELKGKVAIITGGAASIGAAIAATFVDAGAAVVIADVKRAEGEETAGRLGDCVHFCETDITDDDQLDKLVDAAVNLFGGIDFLINCAVIYMDHGFESSRDDWHRALDVNLISGALLLNKVVPHMQAKGGGAVVNFASIAGKNAQAGRALYSVSKAAILHATRCAAMTFAADNIRINSVSPAWTWSTPIATAAGGDRAKADRIAADYHPLGRVGDAEDVANAVKFLCSSDAGFITGADIAVDGGYAMLGADGGYVRTNRLAE